MQIDPTIDWANSKQWENVYAPSSDTFFLCDGIKEIVDQIPDKSIILEVGSGSGYVTAYCNRLLKSKGKSVINITTDFNMECCKRTKDICSSNNVLVFPICDNFAYSFRGPIDVIIFNPPYVDTPEEELEEAIQKRGIEASWAGGEDGAIVIYNFLKFILENINQFSPNFLLIMLITQTNRPKKIERFCKKNGLSFNIILSRNCQGEALRIVTISKVQTSLNP